MIWVFTVMATLAAGLAVFVRFHPGFGGRADDAARARFQSSPNYRDGRFVNAEPTPMVFRTGSMRKTLWKFLRGVENSRPERVNTLPFDRDAFMNAPGDLVAAWFGHSTVLLRVNGRVLLLDPVFSRRASPVTFMGTKAFRFTHEYAIGDLPSVDAVLISHDHYDHLDRRVIAQLAATATRFYVPLGVESHLMRWGVPRNRIVVADWWEEFPGPGELTLTAAPARHFSGRTPLGRNTTLWCSWVIRSPRVGVFFSGDSGYGRHFKQIGERCGPFDLTLLECGQYNESWARVHSFPEEAVRAHRDLRGGVMIPLHWGKFRISVHPWNEPPLRALREAERLGVELLIPPIGAVVTVPPTAAGSWRWDIGDEG